MRKLIFAAVLLLAVLFLVLHLAEVQSVVQTFQRGDWRYLSIAFGLQVGMFLCMAASYRAVYSIIGLKESLERLFLLVVSANFVNVVAPSAGVGGLAVFVSEARRRGYSSARVTIAGAVVIFFDYLAFLCVLALGLVVLIRRNNLNLAEISASIIFFIVVTIMAFLIILGMRSPDKLGNILAWGARQINRMVSLFLHRQILSEEHAHTFAYDAAQGLNLLRRKQEHLWLPFAFNLASKMAQILILLLVFEAFQVSYSIGTLIGGFSIGYLFWIVSPSPAGIGFVEGALTFGLRSLNVPLGEAAVVAIAFRGITFWIPLLFGLFTFRWLSQHQSPELTVPVD